MMFQLFVEIQRLPKVQRMALTRGLKQSNQVSGVKLAKSLFSPSLLAQTCKRHASWLLILHPFSLVSFSISMIFWILRWLSVISQNSCKTLIALLKKQQSKMGPQSL
jgi:hypothetical protein